MHVFSIEQDYNEVPEEKLGDDRVGSKSFFDNFGASLFLMTLVLIVFALLIIVVILIIKGCCSTEKNMERIRKLKRSIFWNKIIRYLFLSSLKFNMVALVAFKRTPENGYEMLTAVLIFIGITALPVYFARLLIKHGDSLEEDENAERFGTIYSNRNVNSEKKHRVWIYPLSFFYRRAIFMAATVFLIDWPNM